MVRKQIDDLLGDGLRNKITNHLCDKMPDKLRTDLQNRIVSIKSWSGLGDQLWGELRVNLWGKIKGYR